MRRVAIGVAWVCAAALVLVCAPLVSAQGLVPGGAPPDAFLLFTGDVIGYLDPCG